MMLATQHSHTQPLLLDRILYSKRHSISMAISDISKRLPNSESTTTTPPISIIPLKRRMTMDPCTTTRAGRYTRPLEARSVSTVDTDATTDVPTSEDDITSAESRQSSGGSRTSSHGSTDRPHADHVIALSHIEHCMPRAYIRICLAYKVADDKDREDAIEGLEKYFEGVVKAKPYLAGYVTDVKTAKKNNERAEIVFTTENYSKPETVRVIDLTDEKNFPLDYEQLDREGLPPSKLIPSKVSTLLENVDSGEASPVLRVQANKVKGGLIVAIYLHHCVSDGTGFDLITSGAIFRDRSFQEVLPNKTMDERLEESARQKSELRKGLSTFDPATKNNRNIVAKLRHEPPPQNMPGRGCVIMLNKAKISEVSNTFRLTDDQGHHSITTIIMALLWQSMTRARRSSVEHNNIRQSTLLIPVNIRNKLAQPLGPAYFGAAVDSGKAVASLDELTTGLSLIDVSRRVRQAIDEVDDGYVRQMIAFVDRADNKKLDVGDIQASNMDRMNGADMYITSWLKQGTYEHDLGMGLGGPDWVRKPWSRDPGSCIILPEKQGRDYEVVVQMTEADMKRLLEDEAFRKFVTRIID